MTRYAPQWLQSGSYSASQDRRLIAALWPAAASSGCQVQASSGMQVGILAGQVAVPSQNNTGTTLCTSDAAEVVTLTAAPASGVNRIDLVTCHPRGADLDGGANNDFIFDFVTGTAAATPTVPATPAGQVALANIYVPGGSAAVTAGNITDVRPGGLAIPPVAGAGLAPAGYVASVVGPATAVSCGSSLTTVLTLAAPVVAGRWYRVSAAITNGQQQTSPATSVRYAVNPNPMSNGYFAMSASLAASAYLSGSISYLWQAPTTTTQTFTVQALTNAATLLVAVNYATIAVEDAGI